MATTITPRMSSAASDAAAGDACIRGVDVAACTGAAPALTEVVNVSARRATAGCPPKHGGGFADVGFLADSMSATWATPLKPLDAASTEAESNSDDKSTTVDDSSSDGEMSPKLNVNAWRDIGARLAQAIADFGDEEDDDW
eukprot:CAMPEP_0179301848 /NCGR_PEP_ID=MMETSP0797-20121207/47761_1 /TAXON_ID=47934 /ORGANISM="Dinophysis acuminata, Strain DAEP01" /LENGTH=140 /DNA_ID=CAMNT_0021011361 /DNA_START=97 /DNA_END=519 /DNA_ORIENTATION=-